MNFLEISRERKNLFYRYIWFVLGVMINSVGVALITKADLGTSPISSVAFVLSLKYPISFGTFLFAANMAFIIVQKILLGSNFKRMQWLQIVVNVLFSSVLDITMTVLKWLHPEELWIKLLVLIIGCMVLALGICVEIAPGVL